MSLHKNRLPSNLLDALEVEDPKSIAEWAKHFKATRGQIGRALRNLRKIGFMFYPIGGISNPSTGEFVAGKLKNILDSKQDTKTIIARNSKQEVTPRLKSQFRLLEETVTKWPKMIDEAETEANHYLKFLIEKKEELKTLKPHDEDNSTPTKQD